MGSESCENQKEPTCCRCGKVQRVRRVRRGWDVAKLRVLSLAQKKMAASASVMLYELLHGTKNVIQVIGHNCVGINIHNVGWRHEWLVVDVDRNRKAKRT